MKSLLGLNKIIAWIDSRLTIRQGITMALAQLHPDLRMHEFSDIEAFVAGRPDGASFVVFHHYRSDLNLLALTATLGTIGFDGSILVLSDITELPTLTAIRNSGFSGAIGILSTRTSSLTVIYAAIRFVQAGGNFIPLETAPSEPRPVPAPRTIPVDVLSSKQSRFTKREQEVLVRLREGMPNKLIAYHLDLSESTVKIHIRNIMRRMGATNRTQVALCRGATLTAMSHEFQQLR